MVRGSRTSERKYEEGRDTLESPGTRTPLLSKRQEESVTSLGKTG